MPGPTRFGPYRTHWGKEYTPSMSKGEKPRYASPPRPAKVKNYNSGTGEVLIEWLDKANFGEANANEVCNIPFNVSHPYMGLGWGVYAGIEIGSECLVSFDSLGLPYIAAWKPNPLHFDSDKMKNIAKVYGYEFSGDIPLYPVYRVLNEGDVALISRGGSGIVAKEDGTIEILGGYSQSFELDPETRAVFFTTTQFNMLSEAGRFVHGIVRRNHKNALGIDVSDIVTKVLAHTTGLLPAIDAGPAAQPNQANVAYTEKYDRIVETADNNVGVEQDLKDPMISTREGTVIADGDITEELLHNGKALALGASPSASVLPAALETAAMWFRKVFKKGSAKIEVRSNKVGTTQVYMTPPVGDPIPTNNGLSVNYDGGALKLKLDGSKTVGLFALQIEDSFGNKVVLKKLGLEVQDSFGNKATTSVTGIEVVDKNANHVKMNPTGIEVKGTLVKITGGQCQIDGVVAPTGSGSLCGLPVCLFTGAAQTGPLASGT